MKQCSWRWMVAAMALLALCVQAGEKPNIVYILADDMGYADAGFNGGKQTRTPELDKLARSGAILESYYVQPVCSPTRSSLMTGRFVTRTGVYSVVRPNAPWGLPLAERTLAQALREAGYETAICGKWHLGEFQPEYLPTRRGFEHQYGHWFGAIDYFTHMRDGKHDWYRDDKPCNDKGYSTHLVAREACRIIREKPAGKPLFLYVPFNAVHAPHEVPNEYTKPFAGLAGVRRTYAGMLAAMDEAVGQIVAALKEAGLLENTLLLFSSDNGGPNPGKVTSNGPLRAGKGTIYEGGIRVCAFATWPGHIAAGQTIREPLHIVDWYPTLVKLAGGSLEQALPLDGRDILPVLTQGAKSPHDVLPLPGTARSVAALRAGDWKLLMKGGAIELYNLAEDIGEKNNLATAKPEKAAELQGKLKAFLESAVPPGGGATGDEDEEIPKRSKGKQKKS